MKKLNYFTGILIALALLIGSCQKEDVSINEPDAELKKGKNKVGIYHKRGNGTYKLIFVNKNAVPAHLAHGDKLLNVEVTEDDMAQNAIDLLSNPEKWYFYNDDPDNEGIDPSIGTFVSGPETPPAGTGSAQISVTGDEKYNLATSQYGGTLLADITSFKYSTYNPSAGNGGAATRSGYILFNVSFDGTLGFDGRLLYVPKENGTVDQDTWQEWDAIDGGNAEWKWSKFASNGNEWPDGNTNALRTWSDLLSSFQDIEMHKLYPFLGVRVGEPYTDGYTENIDAFKFGIDGVDQTYDFED